APSSLLLSLFASVGALRHLHSFPTRRSSDLQDADQVVAKGPGLRSLASFVRPRLRPRLGDGNVREIHGIAGTETRLRHVKRQARDRKSTRLNSSHVKISYAVFCLKKKKHISY